MKKILLSIATVLFSQFSFSQNVNLTFRSQVNLTNAYSSLWGYVDDFGNEYALLGTWQGVSVINITNPDTPVVVADIPSAVPGGGSYVWREIKTFNHHAYVTNEEDSALLIIDLTNLPNNNITYHHFFGNDLKTAHTCWVDENGILYLFGFNTYNGLQTGQRGAMLFDLNLDPDNPQYIGQFNGAYIHDGFVRGDTLWASEVYQGQLAIYDVSDPLNFVELAHVTTPLAFTHNSWPTSDNHYVFTTDEVPNSSLTSYDVSDLGNITKLDQVQSNPGSNAVVHNVHLYNNDFAVTSYYHDGVVIFDVSDPNNMIEVGNYDTCPLSGSGYDGDWGVYPFLPSGNIIVSDMQGGLFVFTPNYQKACRLKGTVTDAFSNALLNNAHVQILQSSVVDSTNYLGIYNTGILNHGLYDVQFMHQGYFTKVIHNVQLDSAQTVTLNVQLVPDTAFNISMTVIDSATGNPIPYAKVFIDDNIQYSSFNTADSNGVVSFNQVYTSSYSIYAGSWGHKTRKLTGQQLTPNTLGFTIVLPKGYYDDFFFDFNWTITGTASTGDWERGIPIGTVNGNAESNAGADVTNDYGLECFVTGNGGGNAAADDVDNGTAILTSPVFDLSSSYDPRINCYTWFYDGAGSSAPNDSISLFISNGDSTKLIGFTIADTSLMSQWLFRDFRIKDFVEPSANMHFIVRVADQSASGNICEGGLDLFTVIDTSQFNSAVELQIVDYRFEIYPNPVTDVFRISSSLGGLKGSAFRVGNAITICDLTGRILLRQNISDDEMKIDVSDLSEGIYLLRAGNVVKEFCVAR